ncbi:MAG: hypothetical protein RIR76_2242 [Verrucomicrobiota bacterium]|jgi:cytochrome b subunit of formate dehydrogenase|nr:cytochrome b/b6 domain-containing protein [Opitutaceae bacterium]
MHHGRVSGRFLPSKPRGILPLACLITLVSADLPGAEPAAALDAACRECHSDPVLTLKRGGRIVPLFVDREVVAASAHAALACVDCHEKFDGDALPHRQPMIAVDCSGCHEGSGAKNHPFHRRLAGPEVPAAPDTDCVGCHGKHDTVRVKTPAFVFASVRQPQSCGRCHDAARDHFLASAHGRVLAVGEKNAPDCLSCHRQPVTPAVPGAGSLEMKLAQTRLCESCHIGNPAVAGRALRGGRFVESYERGVHGAALRRGEAEAANCVDCHGAHEMNRGFAAGARTDRPHVAATCARCHEAAGRDFASSVHAAALLRGNADSASCTDCHGEHEIRARDDPASPVHKARVARQVCADCHASLRLTEKYGIASHAFQTFADSYHGLAVRGGAVEVVNCASCHESHGIRSRDDPASSIHPANLVRTCGQCHPGANTRFAVGRVHVSTAAAAESAASEPVLHLVANVYVLLIVAVVGGMVVHNGLDFLRKLRRKLAIQQGRAREEPVAHRLYLRMTVHERLQHGVLVVSFVVLVLTGFMLRYPEAWWVAAIRGVSTGAFEWRGLIHRVAGVALLAAGVWHGCYLAGTAAGRALFRDLLPRRRDFTDPFRVLRYNLGLARAKPAFGRFSYVEKVEYWAMLWGSVVMGMTGLILWFDNTSMGLLTKLGFDISRTIHFYEAVLASLAIAVWHFYFVIFNPDVYPMNLAWLTGRMSEREMLAEHPLELARLRPPEPPPTPPPPAPEGLPAPPPPPPM